MGQTIPVRVMAGTGFVTVQRNGHTVAEDRQNCADRKRNRAHRPHVYPNGYAKGRGACRRNRSAEARNDPHGEQEGGRTNRKSLDPRWKPVQIFLETPQPRRVAVDPITEQSGADEPEEIDERPFNRPKDCAVHDRQRVGDRERRRCDDYENSHCERIGERTDRSDFVSDARLMTDDEVRQRKRGDEKRNGRTLSKEGSQAMVIRGIITVLCGVALYASLFMLSKSRRAARGEVAGPSVVKTPRAYLFGIPNSLLGTLYYPAVAFAVWVLHGRLSAAILLLVVLGAAATSGYLAYSLIYITRRECPYCWTSHVVNWCLVALCFWLFLPDILNRGT
jgi:uncharacterized membrane protein